MCLLFFALKCNQQQINLGIVDQQNYYYQNNITVLLLNQYQQLRNTTQQVNVIKFQNQTQANRCFQLNQCTVIIQTKPALVADQSKFLEINSLNEPMVLIRPFIWKQALNIIIITLLQWLFGILTPVIALVALLSLFFKEKETVKMKKKKLTWKKFLRKTYRNFISTSNHYLSEKFPILGVLSQSIIYFCLVYLIMLVSFDISKLYTENQSVLSMNKVAYLTQEKSKICVEENLLNQTRQNYLFNFQNVIFSNKVHNYLNFEDADAILTRLYSMKLSNFDTNLKDYQLTFLSESYSNGLLFQNQTSMQQFDSNLQQINQKAIFLYVMYNYNQDGFIELYHRQQDNLLDIFLPVHYTGFAIDVFFIIFALFTALVIKACIQKPRFIKYDETNQNDPEIIENNATKNTDQVNVAPEKKQELQANRSRKGDGDPSLKFEGEEGKIEFLDGQGRPDNFLGLQNQSSGDQEQKFKYGCTDDLEDALSSVHMNSGNQNRQMYTGSESLDDILKGYLKSGKALESKLQQISTLKNAIKSLEQVPGRQSIDEMPADAENEDDDEPPGQEKSIGQVRSK
ncbi:UNKNOWN [Stylonychia lemnae]|uniref:Transmembrane protein n=1 Tax=Stylonychia lemnae TaxID=5949 RepID=A0A078AAL8_STYLE|nr:UNKNOWN [Stylonychia lemnae]|eukprot:CDW78881.1 UNKNOWN [Stylonychia lemnae]